MVITPQKVGIGPREQRVLFELKEASQHSSFALKADTLYRSVKLHHWRCAFTSMNNKQGVYLPYRCDEQ